MANNDAFKRIPDRQVFRIAPDAADVDTLLQAVSAQVIERFNSLRDSPIQAIALAVPQPNEDDPAPAPLHPACAAFVATDYCWESWQLHLAELNHKPQTHWRTCDHHRLCAIVPVVHQGRCLAAVKLATPATLEEAEFGRHVELMDLLVRDFCQMHAEFLQRVSSQMPASVAGQAPDGPAADGPAMPPVTHPQVLRALEHIEANLSNPKLTVGRVAAAIDLHPTYLSQIFVEHVGQRMSRFIASRRIDKAKRLLETTDWQIKRIALETGHANPNWFCHVFAAHTGLTPGEYRRTVGQGTSGG